MVLKLLLVATSVIGFYASAGWAYIFWSIIRDGKITLVETSDWIIRAEFWLALVMAVFSLAALLIAIRSKK